MVQRGLLSAATLVACLGLGAKSYAADADLTAVMDRIKALEQKNKDLEQKLQTASQRKTVDAQIDQAIRKSDAAMGQVVTAPDPHCRPLKIGGYLDVTYTYNLNQPDDRANNLRVFDRDHNSFNAHLVELNVERLPQEAGQAGFRFDLAYGTDSSIFASSDARLNTPDRIVDLQQGYISYIAPLGNGLTIDAGKFVTWSGYEVIESYDNINASRSFSFGYGIPFTHTGLRMTYDVWKGGGCGPCGEGGPKWTLGWGVVNGWDNVTDQNDSKTAIFMSNLTPVSWFNWVLTGTVGAETFTDERARFAANTAGASILDPNNPELDPNDPTTPGIKSLFGRVVDPHDSGLRTMLDTTFIFTPFEKWTFALNGVYGYEEGPNTNVLLNEDGVVTPHEGNRSWYGVTGYVKWQFADSWYLGLRGEYFNDDGGSRTGADQELYEGTVTLDWKLADPMHIRFEYRHDYATQDAFQDERGTFFDEDGNATTVNEQHQDTLMMQFLYKF